MGCHTILETINQEMMDNIIAFIDNTKNKRVAIGKEYGDLIYHEAVSGDCIDWTKVNAAILKRYTPSGLLFIKDLAWKHFYAKE